MIENIKDIFTKPALTLFTFLITAFWFALESDPDLPRLVSWLFSLMFIMSLFITKIERK